MRDSASMPLYDVAWYRGCIFLGSTSFEAPDPFKALVGACGFRNWANVSTGPDGILSATDPRTAHSYVVTPWAIHSPEVDS